MLIIGTGGLASDILNTLTNEMNLEDIVLYNDTEDIEQLIYRDQFRILTSKEQAAEYFKSTDSRFIMCIGNNRIREKMTHEFISIGGTNPSYISKSAFIGITSKIAPDGVVILNNTSISLSSQIDEGCIIYLQSGIGHNSHIKKYCLISASVFMSDVTIGEYTMVGIGANFKPGVHIGKNCIIGTGSIVTKSFDDNSIIYGFPAKTKENGKE
jgi:sugar O-acyltransferase (sialic acid O-acetyltransferase NeuD family)